MMETIAINGQTICHKNAGGLVRSTLPDVCKAPSYPVPFVNVAFAKQLAKGTKTVKSHKGAMCGIKGSEFSTSIGDEAGVGGGVKSGVNLGKATWLSWSPNVFAEGQPVTRLSDRMLMNDGNTLSAGGYFTGPVTGASKATLDLLCQIACACLNAGNQGCVDLAVKALPKPGQNGLYSEVTFQPNGTMYTNPDGSPQTRYGVPGSRIDVTTVVGGRPVEFIEMKFPGDRMRGTQAARYQRIANANGKQLQVINIPQDCNNCAGNRPVEQPQTSPGINWWAVGGAVVLGVAAGACIYFTAGGCAIPLGVGGTAAAVAN